MSAEASQPHTKKDSPTTQPPLCGSTPRKSLKSFRQINEEQRRKRANRTKPPSWITRKLAVFITLALIIFATYVYVGRACIPMIRRKVGALGHGRGMGVAFMVIFWILWFMMMWTYVKIITTPPGYARDYVEKAPAPIVTIAGPRYPSSRRWDVESDDSIDPYDFQSHGDSEHNGTSRAATSNLQPRGSTSVLPSPSDAAGASQAPEEVHQLHAFPPTATLNAGKEMLPPDPSASNNDNDNIQESPGTTANVPLDRPSSNLPPPANSRQPPRHPILAPEYRYCQREGFVKPIRAHHCRICATWIGGCVGARNRKFFVNFCGWASLFCFWVFTTLVAINAGANGPFQSTDPLQLVIIVIAGLFGVFTLSLVLQHVRLLALNLSTVESYGISSMKQRESYVLSSMFPWWNLRAQRRKVKEWDKEWGQLHTEGNIWWLGGPRRNWEQVMGKNPKKKKKKKKKFGH
ncbi:hypothetical protein FRB98_002367 [Tulasnella sp. 332]|nr:hypothetical protein FRB98_002367 [Tulasnella sp. 332]